LLACLILLGAGWLWVWPPTFNSSAWVLMQSDQRNLTTYRELQDSLRGREIIGVVIDRLDVFSNEGAAKINRVTRAVENVGGMKSVISLTTPDRPVRRGVVLTKVPFIPVEHATGAQWQRIRRQVTSNLIARNVLVSSAGDAAMVLAVSDHDLSNVAARQRLRSDLLAAIEPFDNTTLVAYSVIDGEVRRTARTDAIRFIPAAMVMIVLVLTVAFRRPALIAAMLANHVIVLLMLPVLLRAHAALAGACTHRPRRATRNAADPHRRGNHHRGTGLAVVLRH
jgi:predicted RND superfamily exporter protein